MYKYMYIRIYICVHVYKNIYVYVNVYMYLYIFAYLKYIYISNRSKLRNKLDIKICVRKSSWCSNYSNDCKHSDNHAIVDTIKIVFIHTLKMMLILLCLVFILIMFILELMYIFIFNFVNTVYLF
jgi:hypothetical protein